MALLDSFTQPGSPFACLRIDGRTGSPGDAKRLFLIPVEKEVFAEEARRFGKNNAFARERPEVRAALECCIKLQDGIRPEPPLIEFARQEFRRPRRDNVNEVHYLAIGLVNNFHANCKQVSSYLTRASACVTPAHAKYPRYLSSSTLICDSTLRDLHI